MGNRERETGKKRKDRYSEKEREKGIKIERQSDRKGRREKDRETDIDRVIERKGKRERNRKGERESWFLRLRLRTESRQHVSGDAGSSV